MTDTGTPMRVLLVDDQELVRAGFRMILSVESEIEVVGEAANGERAVELAVWLRPDVVLIEGQKPGLGRIAASQAAVSAPAGQGASPPTVARREPPVDWLDPRASRVPL